MNNKMPNYEEEREAKRQSALAANQADRLRSGTEICIIEMTKLQVKLSGASLHLLDLDEGRTLTNAIDERFQRQVLTDLRLGDVDPIMINWILYHTDGVVTRFHAGNFHPVRTALDHMLVDLEFLLEMQRRYGGR